MLNSKEFPVPENGIEILENGNGKKFTMQVFSRELPAYEAKNTGYVDPTLRPRNIEAEEAVLGAILIDPDAILQVSRILAAENFSSIRHGWLYQVLLDFHMQDKPFDFLMIEDELTRRGQWDEFGSSEKLNSLINNVFSSLHAEHYAGLVFDASMRSKLLDKVAHIAKLACQGNLDLPDLITQSEKSIFEVSARMNRSNQGPKHIQAGLSRYFDRVEFLSQNDNQIVGIPTGLKDLDTLLGGLQRQDMIVMAGRPGMGKSSLALSVALHATRKHGKKVALFSLEMSEEQLIQRMVAAETGIDSQRLKFGRIKDDEWSSFYKAIEDLSKASIHIDDTPALSILELRSRARRLVSEQGLDLLIIDYMQLMTGNVRSENRQQEVSYISRHIKALARELNIPILALSQLSRALENREDKRPRLSDLRESGSIEQDSDIVLFIYRDDVYNPDTEYPNIAELIVAKHRSGPTGILSVYFKKHLTQFVDLVINSISLEQAEPPSISLPPPPPQTFANAMNNWIQDEI